MKTGSRDRVPAIGRPLPRADGWSKANGTEVYAADFRDPDLILLGIRRALVPAARVAHLAVDEAMAVPGVVAVLTWADVPGRNRMGIVHKDQPVLVEERVRYAGDPLALVLAEDRAALREGLEKIEVRLEPLPGLFDPEKARMPGAGTVQDALPEGGMEPNVLQKAAVRKGDPGEAMGRAEVVVACEVELGHQEHAFLETEAGWARMEPDGRLLVCASTQTPFRDRMELAEILDWSLDRIRVVAPYPGGAFGGKDGLTVQGFLALGALHAGGRPVKMVLDRPESFLAGSKRHPARVRVRLGAESDGTFTALEAHLVLDTGPYGHLGGEVCALAVEQAGGTYRIPHLYAEGRAVFTNNPIGGPFRGFGVPQVMTGTEQAVDLVAEKLGLDPMALRKQNALVPGDATPAGVTLTGSVGAVDCLEAVERHPWWKERAAWKAEAPPFKKWGAGLALVSQGCGYGPVVPDYANAKVEIRTDGRIAVASGVVDMGQGNASTCLQIAGAALNQPVSNMDLVTPDTDRTLPSGSASASRSTHVYGPALIAAAEVLKARILDRAALMLMAPGAETLALFAGGVRCLTSGRELPLAGVASLMAPEERVSVQFHRAPRARDRVDKAGTEVLGMPHLVFSFAAHLARVEVDELTGRVEVLDYLAASDCGRVLDPVIFHGQIQGGVAQGLGYALLEEFVVEEGLIRTPDLATYLLPTSLDVPEVTSLAVETHEPTGPYGLKGAGEIGISGPVPAVANAVADACGVRSKRFPLTGERVLAAMMEKGSGR
jgi:CO/xanthine dehydrogenase Mo-binding subunit